MMKRIKRCLTVILSLAIVMTGIYWCEKPIKAVQASESNTDMLSLKFQRGQGNYSEKIRVVASIDSPNYKAVGFAIAINGGTEVCKEINTKEYPLPRRIEAQNMGVDYAYGPKVIDVSSEYFLTAKWTAKANTTYTVRAWADPLGGGDRIYGQSRCISLDDFTTSYLSMSFEMKNGNLKMSTDDGKTTYEDIKVTYNGAETTAKVVDVTQHGTSTTVHVNIQGVNHTALPSATKFVFKDSTGTTEYGSSIFRNLNPTTATNEADTSWHEVYSSEGENEFVIATTQDFYGFASLVNAGTFGTDKAYLCADLVMNDTSSITEPEKQASWTDTVKQGLRKWTPIGSSSVSFQGEFYGEGHSIEGIYVSSGDAVVGLFGRTADTAVIENLKLKNSYIQSTKTSADTMTGIGSIVGQGGGTLTNISSNAVVVAAKAGRAGGLVGNLYQNTLNLTECSFSGTATSTGATVGGIVARVHTSSTVNMTGCTASGSVKCTAATAHTTAVYSGGLIGGVISSAANIIQSSFTGNVSGNDTYPGKQMAGGVGYVNASTVALSEVYVGGTITASQQCGGFVGYTEAKGTNVSITDCHFDGMLYAKNTGHQNAGGLIGHVYGSSTTNTQTISATRCLLTGTLQFKDDQDHGCILIGKIEKNATFACADGVYYVNNAGYHTMKLNDGNYLTYQNSSAQNIKVTGITGAGAVVKGLSQTSLTGNSAFDSATALKDVTNIDGKVIWGTSDKFPTLLNVPTVK